MNLGDYSVTRELAAGPMGTRSLALNKQAHTSHLLHRVRTTAGMNPRTFAAAMERLQVLSDPHLLVVQAYGWDTESGPWVVTDYTGDADGVVTLAQLLRLKGGWLSIDETRRAIGQLLDAPCLAHRLGLAHGVLSMEQVHVDRAGRLVIEFYGLATLLAREPVDRLATERAEVASILKIGYQLLTGLLPVHPVIPVEHVWDDIDETWRGLFETGLGPTGFTSAAHAYSAARACRVSGDMHWGLGPARMALRTLLGTR